MFKCKWFLGGGCCCWNTTTINLWRQWTFKRGAQHFEVCDYVQPRIHSLHRQWAWAGTALLLRAEPAGDWGHVASLCKELFCRLTMTNMISIARATEDSRYPSKHEVNAMAKRLVECYPMVKDRSSNSDWVSSFLSQLLVFDVAKM